MTNMEAAGVRIFFRIATRWRLTSYEQVRILGLECEPQLARLKSGEMDKIASETLERVSHVLGIYKAINTLLPVSEVADNWIRALNTAPTFGGHTPAERMAAGNMEDLRAVRAYLEAQFL